MHKHEKHREIWVKRSRKEKTTTSRWAGRGGEGGNSLSKFGSSLGGLSEMSLFSSVQRLGSSSLHNSEKFGRGHVLKSIPAQSSSG
mmetsp:Transcript_17604/g.28665  ORF Transcript_17604/g.28665 Transcript_17604/m.28665 type:complete len:86 (-) Transcript_17604:504-761(-)